MTPEEKQLLLKDLCARLPYKVKVHIEHDVFYDERDPYDTILDINVLHNACKGMEIKPYLRPMSSMTDEEFLNLYDMCSDKVLQFNDHIHYYNDFKIRKYIPKFIYNSNQLDYLISHHLDYRGLIEKGLALEAPKDMYK